MEKPRRFRKRMVCSRFSSRSAIAARNFSDKIVADFLFPPLLAKIDNAHERHLLFVYPLSQCNQLIFSNCSIVIAFE